MIADAFGQRLEEVRLLEHGKMLNGLIFVGLTASRVLRHCVQFLLGLGDVFLQVKRVARAITNYPDAKCGVD